MVHPLLDGSLFWGFWVASCEGVLRPCVAKVVRSGVDPDKGQRFDACNPFGKQLEGAECKGFWLEAAD